MGSVRKRGGIYFIRYYRSGKQHEESSGSARRGDAVRLLQLRQGDLAKGMPIAPRIGKLIGDEAFGDVLNDYRVNNKATLGLAYSRIQQHLRPFFGGRRMANIGAADVREYIARRQAEHAANGTINRELALLKRAFTLAIQAGKLLVRPHVPMLREENVRKGFLSDEQLRSVLRHLPAPIAGLITFGARTGWRVSEVKRLTWRNVDLAAGTIRLDAGTTKNREARVFPITAELRELLECRRATVMALERQLGRVIPEVFTWEDGRRVKDFRVAWRNACKAAGVPGRLVHDLRRSGVRDMVRAGIPERVVMKLAGMKTRSILDRYNITSQADLDTAKDLLDAAGDAKREVRSTKLAKGTGVE